MKCPYCKSEVNYLNRKTHLYGSCFINNESMVMSYAIETLEKEKRLIDKCLVGFDKVKYEEAFKRQRQKSQELQKAIELLRASN